MMVSTKHKFVVLSNKKCASSSLTSSLAPYCSLLLDRDPQMRHTTYSEYQKFVEPLIRARIGAGVDQLSIFCLFREPTDWLYSWYRFRQREVIKDPNHPKHWEYTGHVSWHDFLDGYFTDPRPPYARVGNQSLFVKPAPKHLNALKLVRYDQMDRLVQRLSKMIGEPLDIVRFNVSPTLKAGPSETDRALIRKKLPKDYAVYDAIQPLFV